MLKERTWQDIILGSWYQYHVDYSLFNPILHRGFFPRFNREGRVDEPWERISVLVSDHIFFSSSSSGRRWNQDSPPTKKLIRFFPIEMFAKEERWSQGASSSLGPSFGRLVGSWAVGGILRLFQSIWRPRGEEEEEEIKGRIRKS